MHHTLIGPYGAWAAGLIDRELPSLSFRRKEWTNPGRWAAKAKSHVIARLAIPEISKIPAVQIHKQEIFDGLQIETLSWQLPYGRATHGVLLRPAGANRPLPAILAFHDHSANKYFGTAKITQTTQDQHALLKTHRDTYYSGRAWANEVAKRGYVVLVSDAFPFASRRVMLSDVPEHLRTGLRDPAPDDVAGIEAYNTWAAEHEHVMAKSLFSAGTTWPGVFFAEDRIALDVLCARKDVDPQRIGCAGLSGGGMRSVFMAGLDNRIQCAVCVGFMTTWKDLVLYKSFTHTWMTYVPLLPNELDFPEIMALRVPRPTLVLNNNDDELFTLTEMKRADAILHDVYAKAKAPNQYKGSWYPGPHKFDLNMQTEAFEWLDRWLK